LEEVAASILFPELGVVVVVLLGVPSLRGQVERQQIMDW